MDKRSGRMGLVRGAMVDRMRVEFGNFPTEDHDQEEFADFIDIYQASSITTG